MDPIKNINLREYFKVLRENGWTKTEDLTRRSKHNHRVVIFEKKLKDRRLELQLWGDGKHRVSFFQNECMQTIPSDFTTIEEMHEAIRIESTRNDGYKGGPL